jgi:hypothetical protein
MKRNSWCPPQIQTISLLKQLCFISYSPDRSLKGCALLVNLLVLTDFVSVKESTNVAPYCNITVHCLQPVFLLWYLISIHHEAHSIP